MIQAEIKKNGVTYGFTFTEEGAKEYLGGSDLQTVYEAMLDIAEGRETFQDKKQLLDLGSGTDYESIKVWYEENTDEIGKAIDDVLPDVNTNYVKPFHDKITYLGQSLEIYGVKAVDDNIPFVMIWYIIRGDGGGPSNEMLKEKNLEEVTYYQGEALGYNAPQVILPAATIPDEAEALDYVRDYIDEMKKAADRQLDKAAKNATAYMDWNKDDKE